MRAVAVSFAGMQQRDITEAFGFDSHFATIDSLVMQAASG
jgi:predicted nucleic acid-binding protein